MFHINERSNELISLMESEPLTHLIHSIIQMRVIACLKNNQLRRKILKQNVS